MTIVDDHGKIKSKEITVAVVENWDDSAFRKFNAGRQCLIGRDLLMSFDMMVVLDSSKKRTIIRHVTAADQACPFQLEVKGDSFCSIDNKGRALFLSANQ